MRKETGVTADGKLEVRFVAEFTGVVALKSDAQGAEVSKAFDKAKVDAMEQAFHSAGEFLNARKPSKKAEPKNPEAKPDAQ